MASITDEILQIEFTEKTLAEIRALTEALTRFENIFQPSADEFLREGVHILKIRFTQWRDPPVELPADSVIYDTLKEIFGSIDLI